MSSAEDIEIGEFNEALSRYPALIESLTKSAKPGAKTLKELDHYRYVEAPGKFGWGGEPMDLKDVQILVDWKLRHGTFRPTLPKLVASNSAAFVKECTAEAFSMYAKSPSDTAPVIKKLAELKGIGPATASLLLAVHDPENIIFFSDELYRFLLPTAANPKYTPKEFDDLFEAATSVMKDLNVKAVDLEKVAYVLVKESEPAPEPKKAKPEPSGRPRGRPALPESQKKAKPAPSGRPRGRPRKEESEKVQKPASGKPRGRPSKANAVVNDVTETPEVEEAPKPQKGRPSAASVAVEEDEPTTPNVEEAKKKRGRPNAASLASQTPASKRSSAKKIKDEAAEDDEETPARGSKRTKI